MPSSYFFEVAYWRLRIWRENKKDKRSKKVWRIFSSISFSTYDALISQHVCNLQISISYSSSRKRSNQCSRVVLKHDVSSCPNWISGVTPVKLVLSCSALTVEEKVSVWMQTLAWFFSFPALIKKKGNTLILYWLLQEIVSEFGRLSGATVLKNWDLSVTHVIASTDENGACRRTLKILMGILEGKWILNIEC